MNELLLLKGNPSRRRRSGKRRTAAQRAATKRMLAANRARFHTNPKRRSKRRKSAATVAPRVIVRRSRPRGSRISPRRSRRSGFRSGGSSMMALLKNAAFMGGGALVADVGMGLIAKAAPTMTSITSRVNGDGSINYGYYAAKGALIYGMAKYGGRVTRHAQTMAAGAGAVLAYELLKSFVPADGSIPLGYFNPGRIANGGNLGRIMRQPSGIPANAGMGKVLRLPAGSNPGAMASVTLRNLSGLARR